MINQSEIFRYQGRSNHAKNISRLHVGSERKLLWHNINTNEQENMTYLY